VIVTDNIEGNGDASADIGTIATAWAGFGFAGTAGNNYFGLLGISTAAAATGDPLLDIDGAVPGLSAATTQSASVTYGGTIQEGTYTISVQVPDYENEGVPTLAYSFAGLAPTVSNTPALVPGDDVVHTLTYVIGSGAAEIGSPLDFSVTMSGAGTNVGFDHLEVDFEPVPEPSSVLLMSLAGFAGLVRRRR